MIPPEILPYAAAGAGLLIGILITWLITGSKVKAQSAIATEQLRALQEKSGQVTQDLTALKEKHEALLKEESVLLQNQTELEVKLTQEKRWLQKNSHF